jgi:hypothetical protein
VRGYEREHPGELIHIDIKKFGKVQPDRHHRRPHRPEQQPGCRPGAIGPPRGSARSRERRGLRRAGQESGEASSKIERSPLTETARLGCAHGLPPKPRAYRSTERDDGLALHGDREELGCGSELGRQVAVDLEADADLDKDRGLPRHGTLHEIL